jgi:transcription termination factor Rho
MPDRNRPNFPNSSDGRSRFKRRRRRGGGGGGRPEFEDDDQGEAASDQSATTTVSNGAPPPAAEGSDEPKLVVPADKTVILGISGEIGAGKSSLARELGKLGAHVIDVDEVGHEIIESPPVKKKLVEKFGEEILNDEGEINRRNLAAKAFANAKATADLNAIVHPKLTAKVKLLVKKGGNFVVIDAGLLHELDLASLCKQAIYVRAPREARLNRVAARGWDEPDLLRRETAMGDADARRRACQLTVDNSGDPALLTAYAKTILARQIGIDLGAMRRQGAPSQPVRRMNENISEQDETDEELDEGDRAQETMETAPIHAPHPQHQQPPRQFDQRQPPQQHQQHQHPQHQQRFGGDQQQQPPQPQQPHHDPNRPPVKLDLNSYLRRTLPDLQGEAEKLNVRDLKWLKKNDLICEILKITAGGRMDEIVVEGFIEMVKDQHAYIRSAITGYATFNTDTFITGQQLRRYGLKAGMHVTGLSRAPRGNERCPQLLGINTVMGEPVDKRTPVQEFEHLTPLHANERLFMELPSDPTDYSLRIIDLISPIGKGQRGLIVAQPKCGKTVYLQKIAKAIATNNPECTLMVLLVDERPEEVTDMQRNVKGEVVASTFDQHASRHVQCAEMVINKAKRLVEQGKDVVILLDSITRLARAYNTEAPSSGRIMSGGIESGALIKPKQFFGAARNIENGGSLTILATALVDTGSLMDTVIFEEFKGTGNMELVLDRRLANRRVFPAVDSAASGTRKDELLIKSEDEVRRVWALRKFLADRNGADAVEFMRSKLKNYKTNIEFLLTIDPEKMSGW